MSIDLNIVTFILREQCDALLNSEYLKSKGVIALPFPIVDLKYFDLIKKMINFDYLVITSPKAIYALNKLTLNDIYKMDKETKIFAIGYETNAKLIKDGYKNVYQASGNSKSLFELILDKTLPENKGLWIAGKQRSFDLQKMLHLRHRELEIYVSYETSPTKTIQKSNIYILTKSKNCKLLVLSSRNVLLTKNILEQYNLFEEVNNKSELLVNSYNVSQKAKQLGWKHIKIIKKNFTKDILDYIVETSK